MHACIHAAVTAPFVQSAPFSSVSSESVGSVGSVGSARSVGSVRSAYGFGLSCITAVPGLLGPSALIGSISPVSPVGSAPSVPCHSASSIKVGSESLSSVSSLLTSSVSSWLRHLPGPGPRPPAPPYARMVRHEQRHQRRQLIRLSQLPQLGLRFRARLLTSCASSVTIGSVSSESIGAESQCQLRQLDLGFRASGLLLTSSASSWLRAVRVSSRGSVPALHSGPAAPRLLSPTHWQAASDSDSSDSDTLSQSESLPVRGYPMAGSFRLRVSRGTHFATGTLSSCRSH